MKALVWGECPLPGISVFEDMKTFRVQFHFSFQPQVDLAVHLVTGREAYLKHFYDNLSYNAAGILHDALDHYNLKCSHPGALRAAFSTYEAFEKDAKENLESLKTSRKCKVPTLDLNGEHRRHAAYIERMLPEMCTEYKYDVTSDAGHYIAEENPSGFVRAVLSFRKQFVHSPE